MTAVSVILPVYNRAASIGEALDSVLAQSPEPFEVILVDDGSTDDLGAALAPYEGRVRLHRQQNAGVAAARNAGARLARGDWLAFQDSDDLWSDDHLAILARDLPGAPPEAVCHLGDVAYTGSGPEEALFDIKSRRFPQDRAVIEDDPLPLVLSGMTLQGAAIRADVFARMGGFDEGMRMLSDTAFFCQLALEGPFLVTGHRMAEIRRLEGDADSITSLRRKNARYARQMHVRYLDAIPQERLGAAMRARVEAALSGARLSLAEAEAAAGDRAAARAALSAAARGHPSPVKGWIKSAIPALLGLRGYRMVLGTNRGLDRS